MSYKVVDKKIISIPYGAIKSLRGALNLTQKKRFQFLMVRLKARIEFGCMFFTDISIPYGAIKRFCDFFV